MNLWFLIFFSTASVLGATPCVPISGTFVEVRTGAPLEIHSDCSFELDATVTDPNSGVEYSVIFTYPFRYSPNKDIWISYGKYRHLSGCFFPVDLRLGQAESGAFLVGHLSFPRFINSLCDYEGEKTTPLRFEKVQD